VPLAAIAVLCALCGFARDGLVGVGRFCNRVLHGAEVGYNRSPLVAVLSLCFEAHRVAGETTRANMLASDTELVESVLKGAHERYGELVRRYKTLVTTYCYSRVSQRETAEDLAQETFFRGFQALDHLKKPSAFSGWLLSIAHNVCIDFLRNKSRTVPLETHSDKDSQGQILIENKKDTPVMDKISSDEMRDRILGAINSLGEEYRVTLVLRHVNGHSCEEIAETLNVSLGTVTSRLSRAHKLLRDKLAKYVDPER
jgi:RNA polymerase sigma-70 factor (ECF subfamily)